MQWLKYMKFKVHSRPLLPAQTTGNYLMFVPHHENSHVMYFVGTEGCVSSELIA
jgi:hypothetical protein